MVNIIKVSVQVGGHQQSFLLKGSSGSYVSGYQVLCLGNIG